MVTPARYVVGPLTQADAQRIASWRYEGPWATYSARPDDALVTEVGGYMAVRDAGGALAGFFCVGEEARVPGLGEEPAVLDLGVGMDPSRVGRGEGKAFAAVVLTHLEGEARASTARAVVQAWNERSIRLAKSMGFEVTGGHVARQAGADVHYVVLTRTLNS